MNNVIMAKALVVTLLFILLFNIDWTLGNIVQELKKMNERGNKR